MEKAVLSTLLLILLSLPSEAQLDRLFNRVGRNAERTANKAVNNAVRKKTNQVDDLIEDAIYDRLEKSSLKKRNLHQHRNVPVKAENDTRVAIAENLLVDIEGKYPDGYAPKWKHITYEGWLETPYEDFIRPTAALKKRNKKFAIGDYLGKAVLMFSSSEVCDCYADIEINNVALITEKPQTFRVTNFTKIENLRRVNKNCIGNKFEQGGWEGQLTLSANRDGDILMSLVTESYKAEFAKSIGVSYRYIVNDYKIKNEMSAAKAVKTIEEEIAAKKAKKEFMEKSEQQIQALLKQFKKKYPKDCSSCFSRHKSMSIETEKSYLTDGENIYSHTDYNPSLNSELGNNCDYTIKFVGIQQKYSDEKGYYYQEVVRTMGPNEKRESKQGMLSYLFTSLAGLNDDIQVQDGYCIECFRVNSIQWLRVSR